MMWNGDSWIPTPPGFVYVTLERSRWRHPRVNLTSFRSEMGVCSWGSFGIRCECLQLQTYRWGTLSICFYIEYWSKRENSKVNCQDIVIIKYGWPLCALPEFFIYFFWSVLLHQSGRVKSRWMFSCCWSQSRYDWPTDWLSYFHQRHLICF